MILDPAHGPTPDQQDQRRLRVIGARLLSIVAQAEIIYGPYRQLDLPRRVRFRRYVDRLDRRQREAHGEREAARKRRESRWSLIRQGQLASLTSRDVEILYAGRRHEREAFASFVDEYVEEAA